MRDLLQRPDLFSINTATLGYKTPLPAIIDACAARGIGAIAPWRRELQGEDLQQIARQLAASNMSVSGLCRSTYYTAPTLAERKLAIDDNRRALDDAAVLNAACYMQVVGGLPQGTKDLYEAREQVKQGIRQLLPHSKDVGVPIALEPLHPMTAADRSCLCTLRQALDWCDELDPDGEFWPRRGGGCLSRLVGSGARQSDPACRKTHPRVSCFRLVSTDHRSGQ
ncbi:Hydroxypyruvate isomerase [Escherichia coli]|uniref:Hydroxypyruvate isomerase n=1 Tax=Escherichia coli TaxID=562 RepID=A0A376YGU8_ECOLX|nr:Hydroxypyruvate isomerase [Escherichia coli]